MRASTGFIVAGLIGGVLASVVIVKLKQEQKERDPEFLEESILTQLERLEKRLKAASPESDTV